MRTGTHSIPSRIQTLGLSSYREYLASEHWQNVRRRFWQSKLAKGRCCAGCKRGNMVLSLHHRTYKRLGRERLTDLVLLCDDCHSLAHSIEGKRMSLWKATKVAIKQRISVT